ncbi:CPBP family intramembrane glutamic endopeptidase [Chloroflexota bacterium]
MPPGGRRGIFEKEQIIVIETQEAEVEVRKPLFWSGLETIGLGMVVLVAFLSIQIFTVAIFSTVVVYSNSTPNINYFAEILFSIGGLMTSASTVISAFVCTGLVIAFIRFREGAGIREYLGLNPIDRKTVLTVLAIATGFLVISDSLTVIIRQPLVPEALAQMYRTSFWPALLLLALIVFAPAFEEIFFRGFLFQGLQQSKAGYIGAIAVTAIVWAFVHIQYDPYAQTMLLAYGIVLGFVRYKTGSVWSVLLMHGLHNLVASVEAIIYLNGHLI